MNRFLGGRLGWGKTGGVLGRDARAGGGRRRAAGYLDGRMHRMGGGVGYVVGGRFGVRSAGCQCIVSL